MKVAIVAALLGTLAGVSGCASFATMKTARAIDPGTTQVSANLSAIAATVPKNDGSGTQALQVDPQFELGVRYGLADGFDMGFKLWFWGGEVNSTISLVRSRYFDLALAPSVGVISYSYTNDSCADFDNCVNVFELYGKLPLLFGLRFGPNQQHEFVFGPELVGIGILTGNDDTGGGTSQSGALLGGVVGVSIKASPFLRVMPELTVLTPISHFFGPTDQVIDNYGTAGSVFYELGLGFSWGNDGFVHPRYSYAPPQERYYAPPPRQYYQEPPPQYQPAPYRGDE